MRKRKSRAVSKKAYGQSQAKLRKRKNGKVVKRTSEDDEDHSKNNLNSQMPFKGLQKKSEKVVDPTADSIGQIQGVGSVLVPQRNSQELQVYQIQNNLEQESNHDYAKNGFKNLHTQQYEERLIGHLQQNQSIDGSYFPSPSGNQQPANSLQDSEKQKIKYPKQLKNFFANIGRFIHKHSKRYIDRFNQREKDLMDQIPKDTANKKHFIKLFKEKGQIHKMLRDFFIEDEHKIVISFLKKSQKISQSTQEFYIKYIKEDIIPDLEAGQFSTLYRKQDKWYNLMTNSQIINWSEI